MTTKKLNVYPFTGCCGAYILHGFFEHAPYFCDPAKLEKMLDVTLKDYTGHSKNRVQAQPSWSSVGGPPLFMAILTQGQKSLYGAKLVDYGFVEIAAGYNYANDCHLYVLTRKGTRHSKPFDSSTVAEPGTGVVEIEPRFRDRNGKFAKRAVA